MRLLFQQKQDEIERNLREVAGSVCIGIQYDWWLEKNWICHECNNQLYICG